MPTIVPASHDAPASELADRDLDGPVAEVIDLVNLPRGAHPMPFASVDYEEVPRTRHLDCSSYRECLGFVVELGWKSFSCRKCPRFSEDAQPPRRAPEPAETGTVGRVIWLRRR